MGKVQTFEEVLIVTEAARKEGKTIVATNGCFDILHVGHVRNLQYAKTLGDVLVVGVNSDESVRTNKDSSRPIVGQEDRAELIAGFASVDHVFIFSERTPFSWIKELRPDIHVKGGGEDIRNHPDLAEQIQAVEGGRGQFILIPHHEGRSTTNIIKKILSLSISLEKEQD